MVEGERLGRYRAVIWDLDGTLYEGTEHFDFYAARLEEALPAPARAGFRQDYAAAKAGRHTLRIGTVYDSRRDRVLSLQEGAVVRVWDWSGRELPEADWAPDYPPPVTVDHRNLYNVGDLWWVPAACAAHHGLEPRKLREAFLATREYMTTPDFRLQPVPGLAAAMQRLRESGVIQVLVTNSPQPDSEVLVAKAGLKGLFDLLFFETGKPAGMQRVLDALARGYGIPATEVLSIGDNYLNDLLPVRQIGGRTLFIDPHGVGAGYPCDLRVRSVGELLPHLLPPSRPMNP